jgi:maltose/moltooligosaccharide transporter
MSTQSTSVNSPYTPRPAQGSQNMASPLMVSIGFLGIQFAWALQMGQMSPLLEKLGSEPWLTSLIWAAGPVTGILVQPIVGVLSDQHRSGMGRRRPFLLIGSILIAISLVLMPNSQAIGEWFTATMGLNLTFPIGLLVAAILLWVMDASINLTQGPYRALVPDVFSPERQTKAYSMMSLTIGLGSIAAFMIAFVIDGMHILFYLGAIAILVAMGITIFTTPEEPSNALQHEPHAINTRPKKAGMTGFFNHMWGGITLTPNQWVLCLAHSGTWFGLMCLFIFFAVFVPKVAFGAVDPQSVLYADGVKWASLGFAILNGVCFAFSPFIDKLCNQFGKKVVHTTTQLLMAIAMMSLFVVRDPILLLVAMGLIGMGWATTLSVPFAMLSNHIPKGKEGVLMGVFNIFIAAPGLLCSLAVGPIISQTGMHEGLAFLLGGAVILLSTVLLQRFKEGDDPIVTAA